VDINLIRSLVTLALFLLFIVLIWQVFSKKNKRHYEDASKLVFDDGDERSQEITPNKSKVKEDD